MTIAQRNELMKMEYITTGMTYEELSAKYDMSESSVSIIARNGKWKQKILRQFKSLSVNFAQAYHDRTGEIPVLIQVATSGKQISYYMNESAKVTGDIVITETSARV